MSPGHIAAAVAAVLIAAGVLWRRRQLSTERVLIGLAIALALGVYASGVLSQLPDPKQVIEDVAIALGPWTYALVGVMAFLETGAFVGLIAPGETVVIAGGVIAGQGEIQLIPLIGLVWVCAVLGDSASFSIGRRLGRSFLERHGPRVEDHPRAARTGRPLLRPPRWQDDPDRPLHRARARDRSFHRRLVGARVPLVPAVQRRRHGAVGHGLLRARLRLLALVRPCGRHRRQGRLRLWADRRRDRRRGGPLPPPAGDPRAGCRPTANDPTSSRCSCSARRSTGTWCGR